MHVLARCRMECLCGQYLGHHDWRDGSLRLGLIQRKGSILIVAIDASLSNTAVFHGRDAVGWGCKCFKAPDPNGDDVHGRMDRWGTLAYQIKDHIAWSCEIADLIIIEGYSLGSKGKGLSKLMEFGGILRWELLDVTKHMIEVTPSQLKKFATGVGNANKTQVITAIAKRYDVDFKTDDEYDAFALYMLGLTTLGIVCPTNSQQRQVSSDLLVQHELLRIVRSSYDGKEESKDSEEESCEAKDG